MKRQKQVLTLLRVTFGLLLLGFVISRADAGDVLQALSSIAWPALALAVGAQALAKIVWAFRWRQILRALGLERSFGELLAALMVGLFYNSLLPTGIGGDVVRGIYASRTKADLVGSYAALLIERAVGIIVAATLATLAAVAALLTEGLPVDDSFLISIAMFGSLIAAFGVLALYWEGWGSGLLQRFRLPQRVHRIVAEFSLCIASFRQPGTRRGYIVATSFALQSIKVLFYVACARAVGLDTEALAFFFIVPASVIAAMLPFTLNGLGVREGVLIGLLVSLGAPAEGAAAFALLALLVAVAFQLLGGVINAFYRPRKAEATAGADVEAQSLTARAALRPFVPEQASEGDPERMIAVARGRSDT